MGGYFTDKHRLGTDGSMLSNTIFAAMIDHYPHLARVGYPPDGHNNKIKQFDQVELEHSIVATRQ